MFGKLAAVFLVCALLPSVSHAGDVVERSEWADAFTSRGTVGTLVERDLSTGRTVVVNRPGAETRYRPASTFKIPNALIALDAGLVSGPDEVFRWNGERRAFSVWEKDMTLKEAMRLSAVPVFQEIARRVGLERMRGRVADLNYGNREIGGGVDRFWLDGPLEITAFEQADFLERLVARRLPVSEAAVVTTRELIRKSDGPRALFAKTGTATTNGRAELGWLVGWVEGPEGVHVFALNHDLNGKMESETREAIVRDLLGRLGVL